MKYVKKSIIILIITILILETLLRLIGFETYKPIEFQANEIRIEPEPPFEKNNLLGYKMKKGEFKIFYPDNTYWISTNNIYSNRITSYNNTYCEMKPQINILGDSFTHGSGIADDETYPFLLQKSLDEYCVNNLGVGGYGVVHAYLLLLNEIDINNTELVIYSYIGEHDNRHKLSVFKKMYPSRETMSEINFATIDEKFNINYINYNYTLLPFITKSVLFNLIEDIIIKYKDKDAEKHEIAKKVILKMNEYCNQNNIKFVFSAISDDDLAKDMLYFCKINNIYNVDISVSLSNAKYNLLPYDDHPNAYANIYFKSTLLDFLITEKIIKISNFCEN